MKRIDQPKDIRSGRITGCAYGAAYRLILIWIVAA
jgi:hypothetical protein